MVEGIEYEAPSWSQIYGLLLRQAEHIKISGFKPDVIVGICRGGWVPARILSDLLDNSNLANVRVESYSGISKASEPVLTQYVSANVNGKKVLVVDEIADSGRSLQLVIEHLKKEGANGIKIATIYYKSACTVKPEFFEKKTENWVIFPWDVKEFLKELFQTSGNNRNLLEKIIKKLEAAGLSKCLINKFLSEYVEAYP